MRSVVFFIVSLLTLGLVGCGASSTTTTGCEGNLPCSVSTNIN